MHYCEQPQCRDQVVLRHQREGVIHANGKYICRNRNGRHFTDAKNERLSNGTR